MGSVSIQKILALAESFEYQALTAKNSRAWAIRSLVSLADTADHLNLFLEILNNFLGTTISNAEFQEWLNKNATFLNTEIGREWFPTSDKYDSFLEAPSGYYGDKFVYSRIYKSPISKDVLEHLKVKESSLLQGANKIPKLYFYKIVVLGNSSILKDLDKKTYNYLFLIDGFKELFGGFIDKEFINEFSLFIEKNKSKLDKIMKFASHFPKYINRGQDGIIFDIAPQYILKIFQDHKAYQSALTTMYRLHKKPDLAKTEVMIYDVGSLGDFNKVPLYYYIMEKILPATDLPKEDLDKITILVQKIINMINIGKEYWGDIKDNINDQEMLSELKIKIKDGAKSITEQLLKSDSGAINSLTSNYNLRKSWLDSLVEEVIMKYLTNRTDLHMGNIGLTNYHQFRFFDSSYSGIGSNINYTRFIDQNAKTEIPE